MADRTVPNEQTRQADRQQANMRAGVDDTPTDDEARLAEQEAQSVNVDSVAENAEEMYERGANQKGEGRIS